MKFRHHAPELRAKARRRIGSLLALCFLHAALISTGHGAAPSFRTLDLSPFHTTTLSNTPSPLPHPQGSQTFDGVPFKLGEGRIELTGLDAASHGDFAPASVSSIPVRQTARRIHLLVGALHGRRDGLPLASIILHFKNQETRTLRLAFGLHTRNAAGENGGEPELVDANSRLVWQSRDEPPARLYRTAFDNPLPGEEISTVDFVSLFSSATPLVFALTLQGGGEPAPLIPLPQNKIVRRATELPDSAWRRELAVRALDSSGRPLPGTTAALTVQDDSTAFFFGQYQADADGKMALPFPPQHAVTLNVRISSAGLPAKFITLSIADPKPWPDTLEVRLPSGRFIGGVVVNAAGQPIPEARVIPFEVTPAAGNQFVRNDVAVAQTDADGRWLANVSVESLTNLTFSVLHAEHKRATVQLPLPELLATNARIVLQPQIVIAGRVVNEKGEAVPRAAVTLNDADNVHHKRTADRNGRFLFVLPEPLASGTVFAAATNYAPASQSVALNKTIRAVEITLNSGSPLAVRLADSKGAAVPGVTVKLYRWNGWDVLPWSTQTDGDGRFKWEHAPRGDLMFRLEKTNYLVTYHSVVAPASNEVAITYNRPMRVIGRVLDAVTRKPIEQFRARLNYTWDNSTSSSTSTGQRGKLNLALSGASSAKYHSISLLLEAAGYEPLTVELPTEPSSATNDFQLQKAKMLEGTVLRPDGTPAPHVEMVLLDRRANASMDEPGKFRRTSGLIDVIVADTNGHFALTPKVDADIVFASHRKLGWARVPFSEFEKSRTITLQRWGYVKGVVRVGDKVESYHYVMLQNAQFSPQTDGHLGPALFLNYKVKPEPDGTFFFNAVPPGDRMVSLRYSFSEKETGSWRLSHNLPVIVKSGETNEITIGGPGRTVLGKVQVKGPPGLIMDWRRGTFGLGLVVELPTTNMPALTLPAGVTPTERQRLLNEHQQAIRAWSEERARQDQLARRSYALLFEENGSFQVPSVPPGTYTLNIAPYDPRVSTSRTLATLNQRVVVPAGSTPHDLGTFELTVTR